MRSLFALIAAAWFAWQAISYETPAIGTGASIDVAGAAISVMDAVRTLSVGLALVSLALVQWDPVERLFRNAASEPAPVD